MVKLKIYLLLLTLISNNLIPSETNKVNIYKEAINLINNLPDGYSEEDIDEKYCSNLIKAKNLLKIIENHNNLKKQVFFDLVALKIIFFYCQENSKDKPSLEDITNLKNANKEWPKSIQYIRALSLYYLNNNNLKEYENCQEELLKLNNEIALITKGLYYLEIHEPNIDLSYQYLSKALKLLKNRVFEKKHLLLILDLLYQKDENIKQNKKIRYLIVNLYLLFRNMIIKKEFTREKDTLFYDKIIEIKQKLEKELVIGAL